MAGYDPKKANPTAIIPEAPAKITRKKKKPKEIAVVIPSNCTGCAACIPFCPVDCIEHTPRDTSDGTSVIIPNVQVRFDECIGCKICANVCERMAWDAIEMWPADEVEKFFGSKLHDKYEEAVTAYEGSPDSNTVVRREA
jgi:Pyruvate/2-oxoacid:ferredoxin oxidoreductase delta subunit